MRQIEGEVYFTPKQAAEHFNLSLSTIKNYIYANKLKTLKTPGGHHRICRSEILATLGERTSVSSDEGAHDFSLGLSLCTAMLNLFKALSVTGGSMVMHAKRVSSLSIVAARAMRMNEADIKHIEMAGLVHDIGHMGVDRNILLRSGLLKPWEYESIKIHPVIAEEMLSSIRWLKDISTIVAQHHERIDGSGYPKGLIGEKIEKSARIISIAEAYDSMVSTYSYKRPVSKDLAVAELVQNSGSQFDGDIVEVFIKLI